MEHKSSNSRLSKGGRFRSSSGTNWRWLNSTPAELMAVAVLLAVTLLFLHAGLVASATGKLWRSVKAATASKAKNLKPAARKPAAPGKQQQSRDDLILVPTTFTAANPSANLDQGKNETPAAFVNPVQWVNGNLNDKQAHYLEGMSVPYRLVLTDLALGSHTVNIEWDTRDQGKAAIDYITHFQRLQPHSQFVPAHSAETVDPLLGLGLGSPPSSTFPIPAPSSSGSPVAGQPTASFNALPAGERVMTIYNGAIMSMPYANEDPLSGASAKTRLTINFTATASTVVLAWGGHIASNVDWLGGAHPGGSPYHTRVKDLDNNSVGNQDRSLKSEAVFTCEVSGASTVCAETTNTYTVSTNVSNPTFNWSLTANTSGAFFVGAATGSSVQVNSGTGGSFTLQDQVTNSDGGVKCEETVTVNPKPICSITGPDAVSPSSTNNYSGPAGMASYSWSISGGGTIVGAANQQNVSVQADSGCNSSYKLTLNLTDTNGCTNSCTLPVQVRDTTPPVFTSCPAGSDLGCNPAGIPEPGTPIAMDNCSGMITFSSALGPIISNGCQRSQTRTYTATDASGNKETCDQVFTWTEDKTAPVISALPGPSTIECTATPMFATPTATDACDANVSLTFNDVTTPGACPQEYSVTRTWTATDDCGNTSMASQTITVKDTTPPTLIGVPANVTVECDAIPAPPTVTATDNCDTSLEVKFKESKNGSCPTIITREWETTDDCGNTATGKQIITVNDTKAPVLSSTPGDMNLQCFTAVPAAPTITATDQCDTSVQVDFKQTESNPGSSCNNVITRTWTAKDDCGNEVSHTQKITVNDTTPPVLSATPGNLTVQCLADVPAAPTITANDACSGAVPVTPSEQQSNPGSSCNNVITRTWTAKDSCNNEVKWTQLITVNDTLPPDIGNFPTPGVEVCAGSQVTIPTLTATDACSGAVPVMYTRSDGKPLTDPFPLGTTTITAVAKDACNNQSVARTFTVTIKNCLLGFCSYTQGGWGATPQGNNPARLLSNNFAAVFPNGIEVGIPDPGNFSMKFTSALAVQNYLPAGGTPSVLTSDLTNPFTSSAGVFGGQVLALKINVAMSGAGKTPTGFGDIVYKGAGCLSGQPVKNILAAMEIALGGGPLPNGCTLSGLNELATRLNESFDNCQTSTWAQTNLRR
jgi:hypothetical protein